MDKWHFLALVVGASVAVVGALTNHMNELTPIAGMIIGGALGLAMPKGNGAPPALPTK